LINSNKVLQKGFSIFTGLSLIFQSFLPGLSVLTNPVYAEEVTPIAEQTITPTETPTPTPVPETNGDLNTYVAQNVEADSVDLNSIDPENAEQTAQLATDKADYAPTDTAIITGTGFITGQTYILKIFSTDSPPVTTEVEVTADENGQFVYAYQLDGTYRPNYTIVAKDTAGDVIAETSFTDKKIDTVTTLDNINSGSALTAGSSYPWSGSVNPNTVSTGINVKLHRIAGTDTCPTTGATGTILSTVTTGTGGMFSGDFTAPAAGSYKFYARFFGDNDYEVSNSPCQTITVNAVPTQVCGNGIVEGTEQCDGSTCCNTDCTFKSASTECRVSSGVCDIAETCTGSSATCPSDSKSTAQCRASAGDCDVVESCNGISNDCPTDTFKPNTFECRVSAGVCDVAETCTGSNPSCPTNVFLTAGTVCNAASCSGTTSNLADTCNGLDVSCHDGGTQQCNPYICFAGSGSCLTSCTTNTDCLPTYFCSAGICTLDTIAPTTTIALGPATPNGNNGWYTTDVHVTVSATDNSGGSGVAETRCVLDPVSLPAAFDDMSAGCTYGGAGADVTTEGQHTVYAASKDNLNNEEIPVKSTSFKIDKTGPTATLGVTAGTPGLHGWYTSDVTVSTSGIDSISNPVTCTADQSQTTETTGTVLNGSCTNDAGLATNAAPLTVKLDKTGPSATLAVTAGTLGTNGWYTSNVTVSTSGSDDISSPVTCTANQFQNTETTGQVFNGECTNDAGLTTDAALLTIKLDKTAPTNVVLTPSGTVGANGWFIGDVTITTTGTDNISGITCTADQYQTTETTGQIFNGACTNDAGLSTNAIPLTVKLDKTGPSAVLTVTAGTLGANGWYTSDATVNASGSDSISDNVICTADQSLTTETTGTVFNGACTNDAGLTTNAASLTVKLDKTGPSANLAVTAGTLGLNGWYTSNITVSTSGTDSVSGPVTCIADQHQTAETAGTDFNGACTNDAGLTTNAASLTVKLDKNAPLTTLTIGSPNSGSNPTYVSTATTFTLGAMDDFSTVDKIYYKWDLGTFTEYSSALTAPALGSHTLYYYAVDNAGNIEGTQSENIVVGATSLKLLKVPVPSGTTPGQYSDPATVSAKLTDLATGLPISGKSILFTIGTQTATANTDGSGVASTTITLTQPSGSYTVSSSFTGDDNYQSSSDSKSFTINKEDAAITYNGDTFVFTAGSTITTAPIRLSAHLDQLDSELGDLTKAKVTFELTPAGGGPTITVANIPVSAAGDALTTINVAVGDYAIKVIISSGNQYWIQNPYGEGILNVVLGSNEQRVTGGGWIPDALSANGRDNFGFTVNYNKNGAPKGNFLFMFRGTDGYNYQLKSNSWAKGGLSFTETNTAFFTAKATLSKIDRVTGTVVSSDGSYTFIVNIKDLDMNVKPVKTPDTFAITIFDSSNNIWKQIGTTTLGGGNIVVHSK